MTFHIPRPVRLAVLFSLAVGVGVAGTLIADSANAPGIRPTGAAPVWSDSATSSLASRTAPKPKPKMVLRVRRPPRAVATDEVLVTGSVTRGATITGRGQDARVHRGRFHIRLKLRVGVNRFTVVARRDGHRTTRRRVRVLRRPPAPPPPTPSVTPAPPATATPATCPPHSTPAPGGCAPADNQAYDSIPADPNYDSIPDVPGIQGE